MVSACYSCGGPEFSPQHLHAHSLFLTPVAGDLSPFSCLCALGIQTMCIHTFIFSHIR